MDRTNAITRLNTEEIVNEVNNVIKNGLDKLLGDHLYRYELLERTHEAIMNLPSIRNELNQNPYESRHQPKNDLDTIKYDLLIEKLTKRIDELTYEINTLKSTISLKDEQQIKQEQRENIKLVIDTTFHEDDISNDIGKLNEQIKKINDFSVASSVASLEDDESIEEASLEEEEETDANLEDDASEASVASLEEEVANLEDDASEASVASLEEEENLEAEAEEVANSVASSVASLEDDVETEKSESDSEEEEQVTDEVVVVTDEVVVAEVASLEEEEEFIEIDIDDVTYCTNNEENGFIYELTEDGDVGDKVGYLKDGEPFFYADEK